jgi:15-cis-phytoene synthase
VAVGAHARPGGSTMNKGLRDSYAHCRRIARRSASSFYYSFLLLPKPKRMAMCALYAFLRRTDDLGDSSDSPADRRIALEAWRGSLVRSMQGEYDDPLLPALSDTIHTFDVPRAHLEAVIDGVEMDLEPRAYETFAQLEQYCHRVASAVGLACLRIWGSTGPGADEPARRCGLAFQLTNILRDLKEDVARNRIYLPREDLERFGYTADDLRAGVRDERFRRLMRFEIERAETFYAEGAELERSLTGDGRRIFGSMVAVYRALLDEIKRLDGDVLSRRVQLSSWKKMRIATRWFLRRTDAAAGARAS